jgi:spectinomycin phosphotransferase
MGSAVQHEPNIDRAALIAAVESAYGIPSVRLAFVPFGFATVCYAVDALGGERYFLKLWPHTRAGREMASRQEIALPIVRALRDRGLFDRVPAPLSTQAGALWADTAAGRVALFPFLSGRTLPEDSPTPAPLRDQFARTIATLHAATPALADVLPPRDTFATPEIEILKHCLVRVASIPPAARPGLLALRSLVLSRCREIEAQIERLAGLQERLRALDGPFVLCHEDMGGSNMLVDDSGLLYVLDWDGVQLAPPEFDLCACLRDGWARSFAVYRDAGGVWPLQLDRFAFYLQYRYLGDLTARFERLLALDDAEGAAQDAELLRGMRAYGFDRWRGLDGMLAEIDAALAEVSGHERAGAGPSGGAC